MDKRAQQIMVRHGVRRTHLARELGITNSAVWQWKDFPPEQVLKIERATGIPRHVLRPDLYPVEAA